MCVVLLSPMTALFITVIDMVKRLFISTQREEKPW